jgi:hypothetical protein
MELVSDVSETDKLLVVKHRNEAQHSVNCKDTRVLATWTT